MRIPFWLLCTFGLLACWSITAESELSIDKRGNYDDIDWDNYEFKDDDETDEYGGGGDIEDFGNMNDMVKMGKEKIEDMLRSSLTVELVVSKAKVALDKLGHSIAKMGGAFQAVGCLVSALSIFLNDKEPDSKELTYMKEQFAMVNSKLDLVTNKISDIDTQLEYQSAKTSFSKYNQKIKTMMRDLQYVIDSPDEKRRKRNRDYFMESFATSYEDSAMVLYDGMMGHETEYFGYDMLDISAKKLKCNIQKMAQVCVVASKTLTNAMSIEGAFFGFRNMTWRLEQEGKSWEERMKKLGARCQQYVNKCAKEWKIYADPIVNNLYNSKHGLSNADLATAMFNELTNSLPQRAWAVWVYKDAWGFGPHTVHKSNSNSWMLWHKFGKCVTVVAVDVRYSKPNEKKDNEVIEQAQEDLSDCTLAPRGDAARRVVDRIAKRYGGFPGGAFYAIQKGYDTQYKAAEGHTVIGDVEASACGNKYKHDIYVFH